MERRPPLVAVAAVFYGAVFAAAVLLAWWRSDLGGLLPSSVDGALRSAPLGLAAGALVALACRAAWVLPPWRRLLVELDEALGPTTPAGRAALACSSGVAEEALFRGALQPWLGLVPTALLFGAAHAPLRPALWPWPFFALAVGLLLGWLRDGTGTWAAAAWAHAAVNWLNFAWLDGLRRSGALARERGGS